MNRNKLERLAVTRHLNRYYFYFGPFLISKIKYEISSPIYSVRLRDKIKIFSEILREIYVLL